MSQFQMTHVALVGARMNTFRPLGYHTRCELAMRRVFPDTRGRRLAELDERQLASVLSGQNLPLWVHNAICDPHFPRKSSLQMAMRRFEGELRDNRKNEVIAAVLTAGFRDREFDPLNLPKTMPLRQRCSLLMHIDTWREAYTMMERAFGSVLSGHVDEIDTWMATSEPEIDTSVAV